MIQDCHGAHKFCFYLCSGAGRMSMLLQKGAWYYLEMENLRLVYTQSVQDMNSILITAGDGVGRRGAGGGEPWRDLPVADGKVYVESKYVCVTPPVLYRRVMLKLAVNVVMLKCSLSLAQL